MGFACNPTSRTVDLRSLWNHWRTVCRLLSRMGIYTINYFIMLELELSININQINYCLYFPLRVYCITNMKRRTAVVLSRMLNLYIEFYHVYMKSEWICCGLWNKSLNDSHFIYCGVHYSITKEMSFTCIWIDARCASSQSTCIDRQPPTKK